MLLKHTKIFSPKKRSILVKINKDGQYIRNSLLPENAETVRLSARAIPYMTPNTTHWNLIRSQEQDQLKIPWEIESTPDKSRAFYCQVNNRL